MKDMRPELNSLEKKLTVKIGKWNYESLCRSHLWPRCKFFQK